MISTRYWNETVRSMTLVRLQSERCRDTLCLSLSCSQMISRHNGIPAMTLQKRNHSYSLHQMLGDKQSARFEKFSEFKFKSSFEFNECQLCISFVNPNENIYEITITKRRTIRDAKSDLRPLICIQWRSVGAYSSACSFF